MKTIEERARLNLQYERDFLGNNLSEDMVCRAYIAGATEQKRLIWTFAIPDNPD